MIDTEVYQDIEGKVGDLGPGSRVDVGRAVEKLDSRDSHVRIEGACTLRHVSESKPRLIATYRDEIASHLDRDSYHLKKELANALSNLADFEPRQVSFLAGSWELRRLMEDTRSHVRYHGIRILSKIASEEPEAAVEWQDVLFEELEADRRQLRSASLRTVMHSAGVEEIEVDRGRIEKVRRFVSDDSAANLRRSFAVLAKFSGRGYEIPELSPEVSELLGSDKNYIRRKTVKGIDLLVGSGSENNRKLVNFLPELLDDEDEEVRKYALILMLSVILKWPEAVEKREVFIDILENQLRRSNDEEFNQYMKEGLNNLNAGG